MVEIKPFKGIIYNKEKIKNLSEVMCPPYDIISEDMQTELYNKHPYNFVRLTLNKITPNDNENYNRYTRARDLFEKWQKEKILIEVEEEAVYPYKISYRIDNQSNVFNGFFVLLKIDPSYRYIKAHEHTLAKPKEDRLNLMRACKTNFEPIELLYIDKEDKIKKKIDESLDKPIIDVIGYDNFNHKLWKLEDKRTISFIKKQLEKKILFIADGHHRYQTSIDFANEMKEKTGIKDENAPFNYIMVVLANMFDKGLTILPTHRLVKKRNLGVEDVLKDLKIYFFVEEKDVDPSISVDEVSKRIKKDIETKSEHKFALYTKNKYYILTLKDTSIMDRFASDRSKTWRTLDVSILHKIVFEHLMGIDQSNIEEHLKYTRVDSEAIDLVNKGKFDFSVIMNATKIEELKDVADAGEHMPQKSTYFLPKMLSGLVMYKMNLD